MKLPDTVLQQLKDPGLLDFMDFVSIILNSGRYELRVVTEAPTWAASEGESVLYSNGADQRVYYYLNGSWHFAAFIGGGILLSTLTDAAAQTLVQVEKTSADLTIRFTASGTEQVDIVDGKIVPVTNNDIDLGDSSHAFKDLYLTGNIISGGGGGYSFQKVGDTLSLYVNGVLVQSWTAASVAPTLSGMSMGFGGMLHLTYP